MCFIIMLVPAPPKFNLLTPGNILISIYVQGLICQVATLNLVTSLFVFFCSKNHVVLPRYKKMPNVRSNYMKCPKIKQIKISLIVLWQKQCYTR